MSQYCLGLGLIVAVLSVTVATTPAHEAQNSGRGYGEVHVSKPQRPMRGFVVLFSTLADWSDADQQAADGLAEHDMLVVGVDTGRYAAALAATHELCHHLDADAEAISHQLQRELGSSTYFSPIVAGSGEGGWLAEQVLGAAPSNTIAGAVSIDPVPRLDARFHPCAADPTIMHDHGLPGFWSIATTAKLAGPIQSMVEQLQRLGAHPEVHSFPDGTPESTMLLALSQPHLGPRAPDEADLSDLPLIELPAARPANMLAIVLSGDGGWRDLDQTIAHDLQDWGVSVVGIDSLRYFWSKKTPTQTANDLARVMRYYTARWHARSVALIGYSFGADVLPFAFNRLSERERNEVSLMALLGFSSAADFEIRVTGWLGTSPSSEALPVHPEIMKVPPTLVQCFYGEDEPDTICPELSKVKMTVIRTSGSHHFDGDYEHLAHIILDGWLRRLTEG